LFFSNFGQIKRAGDSVEFPAKIAVLTINTEKRKRKKKGSTWEVAFIKEKIMPSFSWSLPKIAVRENIVQNPNYLARNFLQLLFCLFF